MVVPSFWKDKITVFRRCVTNNVLSWTAVQLDSCLFRKVERTQNSGGIAGDMVGYLVRIPETEDGFMLNVGDIIVSGWVDDDIAGGSSGNALLEKYRGQSFLVSTCEEKYHLPHTKHWYGSNAQRTDGRRLA